MEHLIPPFINLAILIGILVYYLRAPVRNFVSQRHTTIATEVREVADLLKRAQARFEEFSAKLRSMDGEVAALREQSRRDAGDLKTRIVADARALSERVVADAKLNAKGLFSELQGQLRAELGGKVVERAETLLKNRLTGEDRVRIRREFSQQLEAVQQGSAVQQMETVQ